MIPFYSAAKQVEEFWQLCSAASERHANFIVAILYDAKSLHPACSDM